MRQANRYFEGEWEHESTAGSRIDSVMVLIVGESSSFRLLDDLICLTSWDRSDDTVETSFWISFSIKRDPSRRAS